MKIKFTTEEIEEIRTKFKEKLISRIDNLSDKFISDMFNNGDSLSITLETNIVIGK